ncbi:hypothetical protein UVI_02032970 [Ustilaginoidea virens]|nr:hypothetical protein UVI_02032970 [Ustilaginoidea virens]
MIRTLVLYRDRDVINKCGLDAYFFLRYLKTLLVIFIPICLVVLPILIPINYVGGRGHNIDFDGRNRSSSAQSSQTPTGLDTLAWGNISPQKTSRYTAHLVMAILVVIWVCTVFFFELRVYIKIRQDYLTSAEHRLRASATTVLVNSIPKKWLSEEALRGLFDVFPGGIRNIWLNRDLTLLLDKISHRDNIHKQLESAETELIQTVKKAQLKQQKAQEKKTRRTLHLGALTKKEQAARDAEKDAEADRSARVESGTDAGQSQDVPHTIDAGVRESRMDSRGRDHSREHSSKSTEERSTPLRTVGAGLKGVAGAAGKASRGLNDAIATSNGFMELNPAAPVSHNQNTSSPPAVNSLDMPRSNSPEGSLLTASSQKATKRPHGAGHSMENTVRKLDNIEDMYVNESPKFWQFWKPPPGSYASPVPQGDGAASDDAKDASVWKQLKNAVPFLGSKEEEFKYDEAYESEYKIDMDTDAVWTRYIKKGRRPTHRLPLFGVDWLFGVPLISKKVDTIYWCRQELARLNLEIEVDQKHPERFPLMNSAFIQFNHQIAAHMACQSIIHHLPKHMAPRMNEISPRDVQWGNMAIGWWQEWVRTFVVVAIVMAMCILWSVPVGWTAALGQADSLLRTGDWFKSIEKSKALANIVKAISGVLPAAILALLLFLVPLIFGFLAGFQGAKTGSQKSEFVQIYYFVFLFVQVFLVVSIASFVFKTLGQFVDNVKELSSVTYVLNILAKNLPSAAIYFFSYMILQALSTSSGTLLQVGTLFMWFIMAPVLDSTARNKWTRNTSLNQVNWGAVFPVYTNFACIGIIYCVIAPLISIFAVITFSLLWLAQRYAMLYVNRFEVDTGGVLYPRAINQTFTGLYFMELCLAGLFLIVVDGNGNRTCTIQGVIMIVVCILTVWYQVMLNKAFSPLFRYLPTTFEDEAVLRDEAFQRAQDIRFGLVQEEDGTCADADADADVQEVDKAPKISVDNKDVESNDLEKDRPDGSHQLFKPVRQVGTWAKAGGRQVETWARGGGHQLRKLKEMNDNSKAAQYRRQRRKKDLEAQRAIGAALYGGMHDDIEDLTPSERDALTQHAFLHFALRARRPTVWIPRDDVGVSDDEIRRTHAFSKHIWISNDGTALDSKTRVVYGKNPPDFSEVDIINL